MLLFTFIFSRKNSEKGMLIFQKNSGKGYSVWKKFQIGSVILMTQMASQRKTELIDDFDLVWIIKPQFYENFWKVEAIGPKTALKIVFWRPPFRHKNSENGPNSSSKIPERVDVEIIK